MAPGSKCETVKTFGNHLHRPESRCPGSSAQRRISRWTPITIFHRIPTSSRSGLDPQMGYKENLYGQLTHSLKEVMMKTAQAAFEGFSTLLSCREYHTVYRGNKGRNGSRDSDLQSKEGGESNAASTEYGTGHETHRPLEHREIGYILHP